MRTYAPRDSASVLESLLTEPSMARGLVHHAVLPPRAAEYDDFPDWLDGFLQFRFNNGVPNRLTMGYNNWRYELVVPQQAVYAQDSSTFGRLTVHAGLRLDYAHSYAPEQPLFQQSFVPQGILYPETEIVKGFLDLSPRVGAAYDLRGDGKTSVTPAGGNSISGTMILRIYLLSVRTGCGKSRRALLG